MSSSAVELASDRLTLDESLALIGDYFPPRGDAQVLSVDFKPFSSEKLGFLGYHELLTIEAREKDDAAQSKTMTFFVKSVLPTLDAYGTFVFEEEYKFYRDVVPRLLEGYEAELWAPKCCLIKKDFIVLEDLKRNGYATISNFLPADRLRSAVACLARFHASSMLLEARLKEPLDVHFPGYFEEKTFKKDEGHIWKWFATGIEVIEDVAESMGLNPKYASMAYDLMLEKVKSGAKRGRNVICHCDLWCNNIMFKQNSSDDSVSCRFIDYQMVSYNSYMIDLLNLVYVNTSKSTRCLNEYLELYQRVIEDVLSKHSCDDEEILSLQDVLQDFEEQQIFGLVNAAQCVPMTFMFDEIGAQFVPDDKTFEYYLYNSRTDLIDKIMKLDSDFKRTVEGVVKELIDYMEKLHL